MSLPLLFFLRLLGKRHASRLLLHRSCRFALEPQRTELGRLGGTLRSFTPGYLECSTSQIVVREASWLLRHRRSGSPQLPMLVDKEVQVRKAPQPHSPAFQIALRRRGLLSSGDGYQKHSPERDFNQHPQESAAASGNVTIGHVEHVAKTREQEKHSDYRHGQQQRHVKPLIHRTPRFQIGKVMNTEPIGTCNQDKNLRRGKS